MWSALKYWSRKAKVDYSDYTQKAFGTFSSSVLSEWLASADNPIKYKGDGGVPAIVVKRGVRF
jgi:hypothetical protein